MPQLLQLMLNLLRSFTQAGGTLLLTSYDPAVAELLNARVAEVRGGRAVGFEVLGKGAQGARQKRKPYTVDPVPFNPSTL